MRKYFILIFLFLLTFEHAYAGQKSVLIVQSSKIGPYNEAVEGFKSRCQCTAKELVLSDAEGLNIFREIRSFQPDVILAVGINALLRLKAIKDVPIVYAMVSNPESIHLAGANITGVSMNIAPEKQLSLLQLAFPGLKKIGLLYNPLKSGGFVEKALASSRDMSIKIIVKEIHHPMDVPLTINSLKDKIDAFWMIPDSTVFSPETVEYLFLFSFENKIPVLTFSENYLSMGAVMSANIDARDIGKQAGEMVAKILSGANVADIPSVDARKANVTVNLITAKKIGRPLSNETLSRWKVIN
ncbi:MAG: ABC transporter substrate-binding protein [Thermodesulfovibrionales bacterium]